MDDSLKARSVNLALGTWRDAALRDLRYARKHINAALDAAEAGNPADALDAASRAVQHASAGMAAAAGWKGAAEISRLLDDDR